MLKRVLIALIVFTGLGLSVAYADGGQTANSAMGLGVLSDKLMGPAAMLIKVFEDIAIVAGVGFLFAALIQYQAHRRNPLQVRLSKPFFYLLFGILLILLPYLAKMGYYHPPGV